MTTLVWDTSPLWHAAKADRLDVLGDFARGPADAWLNVTTQTVVAELRRNHLSGDLSWLRVVNVDELDELMTTIRWAERLGVDPQGANIGETTVCAWASCHHGTAIIDDSEPEEVEVEGEIATVQELLAENATANRDLIDQLRETVAYLARTSAMDGFRMFGRDKFPAAANVLRQRVEEFTDLRRHKVEEWLCRHLDFRRRGQGSRRVCSAVRFAKLRSSVVSGTPQFQRLGLPRSAYVRAAFWKGNGSR